MAISPAELVKFVLDNEAVGTTVVVGPASNAQQQEGVISIVQAGLPVIEKYAAIQWMRCQVRCLSSTLQGADRIAWAVQAKLHGRQRVLAVQGSTNETFLIHLMNITAGPSMHYDTPETHETLLFAEIMIGSEPTQSP